jgi:ferredoxin
LPSETAAAGEAASAGEPAAAVATVAGADAAAVVATLAPGVDGAAGAPATPPAAGAVAAGPGGDLPSIDTALCTTCNECTVRNPQMFAYNAAKQAYIRDPRAGTYRELVETAENCPVCIIHPGKPLDPNEPGLEDLIRRAAALA